jgi:hypothetical protein
VGDWLIGRTEPKGVTATGVDVHLGWDLRLPQRQEVGNRVVNIIDRIIFRRGNELRRRLRADVVERLKINAFTGP